MDKNNVRPIYRKLQRCLLQTSRPIELYDDMTEESIWIQYNDLIDNLNNTTGDNYDKFKVVPEGDKEPTLKLTVYRDKLGGLINHLRTKYFPDEPEPH